MAWAYSEIPHPPDENGRGLEVLRAGIGFQQPGQQRILLHKGFDHLGLGDTRLKYISKKVRRAIQNLYGEIVGVHEVGARREGVGAAELWLERARPEQLN